MPLLSQTRYNFIYRIRSLILRPKKASRFSNLVEYVTHPGHNWIICLSLHNIEVNPLACLHITYHFHQLNNFTLRIRHQSLIPIFLRYLLSPPDSGSHLFPSDDSGRRASEWYPTDSFGSTRLHILSIQQAQPSNRNAAALHWLSPTHRAPLGAASGKQTDVDMECTLHRKVNVASRNLCVCV